MRYFIDTEFIEDGRTIDLISIGIVDESDREYYAINSNCQFDRANEWVQKNVYPSIGITLEGKHNMVRFPESKSLNELYKTYDIIATEIKDFILANPDRKDIEVYADYGHYDYVALCQLYGAMCNLPKGFPYYFFDIQSMAKIFGKTKLPDDLEIEGKHNALLGAKSCKQRFEYLADRT